VPLELGGLVPLLGLVLVPVLGLLAPVPMFSVPLPALLPLPVTRMWSTTLRLPANDWATRRADCRSLPVGQVPVSSICVSVTLTLVLQVESVVSALIAVSICDCSSDVEPAAPAVPVVPWVLLDMFPNGVLALAFDWPLVLVWPAVVLCAFTSLCGTVVVELCALALGGTFAELCEDVCEPICEDVCALCWLASPIGG
jgi:hypothetical protein